MQPFRRPGEMAFVGDHPEIAKVVVIQLSHKSIYKTELLI
jgi:hypothetical protein